MGGGVLNARRRMMTMTQEVSKPYDAEVEYLEVNAESGHAYINTRYIATGADINCQVVFMPLGYSEGARYAYFFGTPFSYPFNDSGENGVYRVLQNNGNVTGSLYINWGWSQHGNVSLGSFRLGEQNHIEINGRENGVETIFNDRRSNIGTANAVAENAAQNPITLFSIPNTISDGIAYLRFYSFRLDKAGVPQLDLIPVRRGTEGFMYDRVSGKLLGNSGTGRFVLGPDLA